MIIVAVVKLLSILMNLSKIVLQVGSDKIIYISKQKHLC